MNINNQIISKDAKPFVIAELSANHNGSIERAKDSIKEAKKAGADAIKIQTYTAETMTIRSNKNDFLIKDGLWDGYQLFDLYDESHTPFEWHEELFNYAKEIGITIFSSPFDESAVDLLEELRTPAYKLASFEICDLPLISYIAKTKKPIFISTGMANLNEIDEALEVLKNEGYSKDKILLFHCISSYPTSIKDSNLGNIKFLSDKYSVEVGLSDHTIGNEAAISAISLGASAVEKHFTLSREEKGPDSSFSIEPEELKKLVLDLSQIHVSISNKKFSRAESEIQNKVFRRSLYFVKKLKKGQKILEGDIRRIRPGFGLMPKYYEDVIGRKLLSDVDVGDRVIWDLLD